MRSNIICRMLDAEGNLLGWLDHSARIRGDGGLRARGQVVIPIDRAGFPVCISLHWADVNVETKVPTPPGLTVRAGDSIKIFSDDEMMVVVGPMPGKLPAVTLRQSVEIGMPVGQLGARG